MLNEATGEGGIEVEEDAERCGKEEEDEEKERRKEAREGAEQALGFARVSRGHESVHEDAGCGAGDGENPDAKFGGSMGREVVLVGISQDKSPEGRGDESVYDRFAALVIDDDLDIRETLREIIEAEGFPVKCASDGEEALALLAKGFRPGLIVLDLMMPVMSGWDFLMRLREMNGLVDVPVVVISASGLRKLPNGATVLIRKPLELDAVLSLVNEYCRSGPSSIRTVDSKTGRESYA